MFEDDEDVEVTVVDEELSDDEDVEVEVKPKPKDDDDDDLSAQSESVRKRIGKLTYKVRETERREQAALDYAKDKQELLVHCAAGVSRSSAIAYLIACSRVGTMEALKVLDSLFHWPNNRVVRLGAEIMDNPEIEQVIKKWKSDHGTRQTTIIFT